MPFTIREATSDDAPGIARALASDETSEFFRLQLGTVDPAVLHDGVQERINEGMAKGGLVYVVACDSETKDIVSYAQWILPKDFVDRTPEEKARANEEYRSKLLPGMNVQLVMDFNEKVQALREEILQRRPHYLLGNIFTLPSYQRRGAATALVRWPFEEADKQGHPVYLDTDANGGAIRLYDKLGFERREAIVFDLSKYGSQGEHTHVAMIREPKDRA